MAEGTLELVNAKHVRSQTGAPMSRLSLWAGHVDVLDA